MEHYRRALEALRDSRALWQSKKGDSIQVTPATSFIADRWDLPIEELELDTLSSEGPHAVEIGTEQPRLTIRYIPERAVQTLWQIGDARLEQGNVLYLHQTDDIGAAEYREVQIRKALSDQRRSLRAAVEKEQEARRQLVKKAQDEETALSRARDEGASLREEAAKARAAEARRLEDEVKETLEARRQRHYENLRLAQEEAERQALQRYETWKQAALKSQKSDAAKREREDAERYRLEEAKSAEAELKAQRAQEAELKAQRAQEWVAPVEESPWTKVKDGMTPEEVRRALGEPKWTQVSERLSLEFWMYEERTILGRGVVVFDGGRVSSWRPSVVPIVTTNGRNLHDE